MEWIPPDEQRLVQCFNLDDSGTSGFPVVTLGGFLAHSRHWETMEPAFDAMLNKYGVETLHGKEFNSTKDQFEGWSKIKKRSFTEELFGIAHGRMLGMSVTVIKDDIIAYKKKNPSEMATMSPIGVCFASLMMRTVTDPRYSAAAQKDGVAFLVDTGNKNNSEIEQYFHKLAKEPAFKGCLRAISFITKKSCRAIQVADFFVYYSRRYMRDNARFRGRLSLPRNTYLELDQRGQVVEYVSHSRLRL